MTPNLPPNPQAPHRYTEPTTPTERHRNAREALAFVSNFPKLQDWVRDVQISPLAARASHQIDDIANTLADQLADQYGINFSPNLLRIYLAECLQQQARTITDLKAGRALDNGESKANIARAAGAQPTNCDKRFPNIEAIRDAYRQADETGIPQTVTSRDGKEITIEPEEQS